MRENHLCSLRVEGRKEAMKNQTATRELAAAQRRVMRAWTRLEQKRDDIIKSLRAVEDDMAAIQPVLNAILGKAAA
jgi:uncharacterized protein with WD repeat